MNNADDGESDGWVDTHPNGPLEVASRGCGDTFKEGRRFLDMTYAELHSTIQHLHVCHGGLHLDVHCRPFGRTGKDKSALPGKIKFYCPHSRDHRDNGDQKRKKALKNPDAPRAIRSEEERRVYFNKDAPCGFHFFVRRDAACVVPNAAEGSSGHKEFM